MPEWLAQTGFGAVLTVIGWLIVNKLNRIDSKLDRVEERQTKTEKDCVTWADLEKTSLQVQDHERRLTITETTCKQEHGK